MINKISFEIQRLEKEANNYNQTKSDKTIQNLDFFSIKNSLQNDIKYLYNNDINIQNNEILNKIDTKYLAILDLTKYKQVDLIRNYHKNINVLKDILNKLQQLNNDNKKI